METLEEEVAETAEFPINRRHQGLATNKDKQKAEIYDAGFQSIGVTKDLRQALNAECWEWVAEFPINRRHQELATVSFRAVFRLSIVKVSNQ